MTLNIKQLLQSIIKLKKMTHSDIIIIITATLFISSTIGVYAALKYINVHTNPPMNTLLRSRGDIELQYIEPSTNNTLDLLTPDQVYTCERVPCTSEATYNTSESIPNHLLESQQVYNSWSLPSYHNFDLLPPEQVHMYERITSSTIKTISDNSLNIQQVPSFIHSCLEDSINLNYIFIVGTLFLIVILSNSLLGLNPYEKWLHIIKIISIILILYYSTKFKISTAIMLPLSISRISFLNDLDIPIIADFESQKIEYFRKFTIEETSDFLNKLEDDESYILELEFIPNIALWDLDSPAMLLSKPFLINRNSSATTITKFILERLDFMVDYYYLDDTIIQKESNCAVSLTYCKLLSHL